jgi:hypothetical protein
MRGCGGLHLFFSLDLEPVLPGLKGLTKFPFQDREYGLDLNPVMIHFEIERMRCPHGKNRVIGNILMIKELMSSHYRFM